MKEISDQLLSLQYLPLVQRDSSGTIRADPDQLIPWNERPGLAKYALKSGIQL
jgi:hypothetical protein